MASRRNFISASLGVAVLGGVLPAFVREAAGAQSLPSLGSTVNPDNVLLVIDLNGGNDGLNTVVPYSDDSYHRVRPGIGLDAATVLRIDDRIGLNPALAALNELYKEGHVALVQGVGYPNPNRSHFEATQIWETASPDRPESTGWLGRYLDGTATPHAASDSSKLFTAVALGDTVPTALLAQHVDVPAVGTLSTFGYNAGRDLASKLTAGALYDGAKPGQSPYLGLIEGTARTAMRGGDLLKEKLAGYKPMAEYPKDGFAQQLQLAAQIIGSNVGTRIIFVSIGSFDTHAGQRAQQDRLLGYLANGLAAFYADLEKHSLADNVLAMTFSEFGRRVQQNASSGTDHGTAMPLFIVGGRVKAGVYGAHPSLTDLDNGDLKHAIDFRSIYATVLEKWLGRDAAPIIAGTYSQVAFV